MVGWPRSRRWPLRPGVPSQLSRTDPADSCTATCSRALGSKWTGVWRRPGPRRARAGP